MPSPSNDALLRNLRNTRMQNVVVDCCVEDLDLLLLFLIWWKTCVAMWFKIINYDLFVAYFWQNLLKAIKTVSIGNWLVCAVCVRSLFTSSLMWCNSLINHHRRPMWPLRLLLKLCLYKLRTKHRRARAAASAITTGFDSLPFFTENKRGERERKNLTGIQSRLFGYSEFFQHFNAILDELITRVEEKIFIQLCKIKPPCQSVSTCPTSALWSPALIMQ